MARKREYLWVGLVLAGAALAAFLLLLRDSRRDARARIDLEQAALEHVRAIVRAQRSFHEARGRYGWLDELGRAGLLDGVRVAPDGSLALAGYRIDVLLPYGLSPREIAQLAPKTAGKSNPRLERQHFAVVARPWGRGPTGYRSYYVDESEQLFVNEGVRDVGAGLAMRLPELHLTHGKSYGFRGLRWTPMDRVKR